MKMSNLFRRIRTPESLPHKPLNWEPAQLSLTSREPRGIRGSGLSAPTSICNDAKRTGPDDSGTNVKDPHTPGSAVEDGRAACHEDAPEGRNSVVEATPLYKFTQSEMYVMIDGLPPDDPDRARLVSLLGQPSKDGLYAYERPELVGDEDSQSDGMDFSEFLQSFVLDIGARFALLGDVSYVGGRPVTLKAGEWESHQHLSVIDVYNLMRDSMHYYSEQGYWAYKMTSESKRFKKVEVGQLKEQFKEIGILVWCCIGPGGKGKGKKKGQHPPQGKKKKKGKPHPTNVVDVGIARYPMPTSVAAKRPSGKPRGTQVMLPRCTLDFAAALADPLNPSVRGVCIPVDDGPTMKAHMFTRVDLVIGTAGSAAVYVTPTPCNDLPCMLVTNSTFAGGVNTPLTPYLAGGVAGPGGTASINTAGGWSEIRCAGPVNFSSIAQTTITGDHGLNVAKVVCCGVRAVYTGTVLNESGMYSCYHEPGHLSLAGLTPNELYNYAEADVSAVTRKPCTLVVFPINDNETHWPVTAGNGASNDSDWTYQSYPYSAGQYSYSAASNSSTTVKGVSIATSVSGFGVGVGAPVALMVITGVPGQTVHLEYSQHIEVAGYVAGTMATSNFTDIEGTKRVQTAALAIPAEKVSQPKATRWSIMVAQLGRIMREAKPILVPLAEKALTMMLA